MAPDLMITKGSVMTYYCFDIANEIKIDEIESVFGKRPVKSNIILERLTPNYVKYTKPPLLLRLGKKRLGKFNFETEVKLYEFGVITVRFWMPIKSSLKGLKALSSKLINNKDLEKAAKETVNKIKEEIELSVETHKMDVDEFFEDYIIFEVNKFSRKVTPDELLEKHRFDIAKALRCEEAELSRKELLDAVKFHLSYYADDIVFIDWNAAFIFDEKHTYDVTDVLEYAVIELLELRTYDTVLDRVLDKAYTDLLKKNRFSLSPHTKTLSYLTEVRLEVSDVIEKVENSLKLVGDLYLAKVYTIASGRFYHEKWRRGVEKKLETLESIYTTLSSRQWDRKLLLVEVFMGALFMVWFLMELFLLFVGK